MSNNGAKIYATILNADSEYVEALMNYNALKFTLVSNGVSLDTFHESKKSYAEDFYANLLAEVMQKPQPEINGNLIESKRTPAGDFYSSLLSEEIYKYTYAKLLANVDNTFNMLLTKITENEMSEDEMTDISEDEMSYDDETTENEITEDEMTDISEDEMSYDDEPKMTKVRFCEGLRWSFLKHFEDREIIEYDDDDEESEEESKEEESEEELSDISDQDETEEQTKEQSKEESQEQTKEQSKEESQEQTKEQTKEQTEEQTEEQIQEEYARRLAIRQAELDKRNWEKNSANRAIAEEEIQTINRWADKKHREEGLHYSDLEDMKRTIFLIGQCKGKRYLNDFFLRRQALDIHIRRSERDIEIIEENERQMAERKELRKTMTAEEKKQEQKIFRRLQKEKHAKKPTVEELQRTAEEDDIINRAQRSERIRDDEIREIKEMKGEDDDIFY